MGQSVFREGADTDRLVGLSREHRRVFRWSEYCAPRQDH
jgi:hypothetical protein